MAKAHNKAKAALAEIVNLAEVQNDAQIKKLLRSRSLQREGIRDENESKSALKAALGKSKFGVVLGVKFVCAIEQATPQRRLSEYLVLDFLEDLVKRGILEGNAIKLLDDLKIDSPVVKFGITKR